MYLTKCIFTSYEALHKDMVYSRCKMVVKAEIEKAGLQPALKELGRVELEGEPTKLQLQQLNTGLKALGFEMLDDKKIQNIEKINNTIAQLIYGEQGFTEMA